TCIPGTHRNWCGPEACRKKPLIERFAEFCGSNLRSDCLTTHTLLNRQARGDAADVVTLRAALTSRMRQVGGQVLYAAGTKILTNDDTGFAEAVAAAKQADIVLMALGEDSLWMTGEAGSRAHLGFPGNQQQLLEAVAAVGKPIVLIVFSGRPLTLNWAANHVPAILQAWFPGIQAGPALVRVLFGDVNPSGKLTVSMPRTVGQEPLYYDALNTGRPVDGVDLTHPPSDNREKYHARYVDEQNTPLFPFGYGLSYTTFSYSPLQLSPTPGSAAGWIGPNSAEGRSAELVIAK